MRKVHWRDKLAYSLASLAMRIATPWYRKMAHGAWVYGLNAAARDEEEGRSLPPDVLYQIAQIHDEEQARQMYWDKARQAQLQGEDKHDW